MILYQRRRTLFLTCIVVLAMLLMISFIKIEDHTAIAREKDKLDKFYGKYRDICLLKVKNAVECEKICHLDTMCFYSYFYPSQKAANCFTQLFYNDSQSDCRADKASDAILQTKPETLVNKYVEPYIINTPACRKPNYHPFDGRLQGFMNRKSWKGIYWCKRKDHVSKFQINSRDEINLKPAYGGESCRFRYIYRDDDYKPTDIDVSYTDWAPLTMEPTGLIDEFVEIVCGVVGKEAYRDFSSYVPAVLAKSRAQAVSKRERTKVKSRRFPENKVSVLIFTIDSTSLSHGYRMLPQTFGYLRQKMGSIAINGYNRVGQNSFPNAYPSLTGIPAPLSEEKQKHYKRFYDDDPLLFKWFKNDGFVTGFNEDYVEGGLFNGTDYRKGFHYKPADHYYKPFSVRVENTVAPSPGFFDDMCYLNKGVHVWVGDWTSSFVKRYSELNQPYFALSWTTRIAHDDANMLALGDQYYYQLFKDLHESNSLNNTILIFNSDHGYRFGALKAAEIRQYEENNPMMHWVIPEWFRTKYKKEMDTFRLNANNRLTSPFDLHRTVLDFVDGGLESATAGGMSKFGKSWFEPIDENRTCADAGVPHHFCNCRKAVPISTEDELAKVAALAVVDRVNMITESLRQKCLRYSLRNIEHAYRYEGHNRTDKDPLELSVVVKLKPSKATYMATIYVTNPNSLQQSVDVKGFSRMDSYGNTADCVIDGYMKLYCSCTNLTPD